MRASLITLAVTLAACAANSAPLEKPGIERQSLGEDERRDLECARNLQAALAERDPALGVEYQHALADKIIAHAGKPGPVDYGPVCQKLKEMNR